MQIRQQPSAHDVVGEQAEISSKLQISAQKVTSKPLTASGRSKETKKVRVIRVSPLSKRAIVIRAER